MKRIFAVAAVFVAACTSDPGGGGVNIDDGGGVIDAAVTTTTTVPTTSTTIPPTTTTTLPTFEVSGTVTRPDGTPVSGASVTMGEQLTVTGAEGTYSFETPTPGPLTVSKLGWTTVDMEWDETVASHNATIELMTVRGLRVSGDAAADDVHFGLLMTLADETAVNAFVFDTKQEGGLVLYDTGVAAAHDADAVQPIYDPIARIEQAHAADIYAITRVVTFEDELRVRAHPDEKLAGVWLDPTVETARQYNLDLAAEACELGFDEIQFDYVRYPSGRTATVSGQLELTQEQRLAAISGFLADAREVLRPMGCSVSAAIFGIVASAENDQGLGQRPEELSAEIDAVSPMIYPSHYSPGWLGFDDPNAHPYDVTADAITDVIPRMADGSQLRPWLQAFWWSNSQIRRAIAAAEDNGVGWILWNVRSNFDPEAIPTDEELAAAGT